MVEKERVGEKLPKGWRKVRLGDVCDIVARQVDPKKPEYGNLPHVNGENIESGTCRLLYLRTATQEGMTSGKYLFESGDVLYSKLRPYLRKAIYAEFRGVCSADMYPIVANKEVLDPGFLTWILVGDEFTQYADEQSRRARMPKLNRAQLFNWHLRLPPLPEQKRIVGILSDRLSAVEQARAATAAQLAAAKALPAAYLRQVFDGPEAQKWKRKKLGDICNISTGTTPATNQVKYYKGNIPFVKTAEIINNIIRYTETYITQQALHDYSLKLYPPGTVLMAMYGQGKTRGQVAILDISATTTQNAAAIIPPSDLSSEYLWYWLRGEYERLRRIGYLGDISHLSLKYVKELEIPWVELNQQNQIVIDLQKRMNSIGKLQQSLQSQLDTINQLPAALLRQAFNGEL